MPMQTIVSASSDADTLASLQRFAATLPDGQARAALESAAAMLKSGEDVIMAGAHDHVTPSQAAKVLGVSRAHLYKVLDSGALAFTIVGARDRRIAMSDLRDYVLKTEKLRRNAARNRARPRESRIQTIDQM